MPPAARICAAMLDLVVIGRPWPPFAPQELCAELVANPLPVPEVDSPARPGDPD